MLGGLSGIVGQIVAWRIIITYHRRKLMNLCIACGYDLTGNVSGTCPECGEKVG
jgi:hypothetical protein